MNSENLEQARYKIVRQVGIGGMALVYEAKKIGPHGFEKRVALKKMLPELSHNPTFVEKFIGEAKLVAGLSHVNIVQTLDFGVEKGNYFIVNEFIDGYSLSQIFGQAKFRNDFPPVPLAIYIIREACKGLSYAHDFRDDKGVCLKIIHRDISPGNIMVSRGGAVKINDFGISKSTACEASVTVVGKPAYMSPEQIAQKAIDHRSDLFSLGVIFYELLSGKLGLFATGSIKSTLTKVEECVIPPFAPHLQIPRQLEAIVLRMLSKDRKERFETATDVQEALNDFLFQRQMRVSINSLADYLSRIYAPKKGHDAEHDDIIIEMPGSREAHQQRDDDRDITITISENKAKEQKDGGEANQNLLKDTVVADPQKGFPAKATPGDAQGDAPPGEARGNAPPGEAPPTSSPEEQTSHIVQVNRDALERHLDRLRSRTDEDAGEEGAGSGSDSDSASGSDYGSDYGSASDCASVFNSGYVFASGHGDDSSSSSTVRKKTGGEIKERINLDAFTRWQPEKFKPSEDNQEKESDKDMGAHADAATRSPETADDDNRRKNDVSVHCNTEALERFLKNKSHVNTADIALPPELTGKEPLPEQAKTMVNLEALENIRGKKDEMSKAQHNYNHHKK